MFPIPFVFLRSRCTSVHSLNAIILFPKRIQSKIFNILQLLSVLRNKFHLIRSHLQQRKHLPFPIFLYFWNNTNFSMDHENCISLSGWGWISHCIHQLWTYAFCEVQLYRKPSHQNYQILNYEKTWCLVVLFHLVRPRTGAHPASSLFPPPELLLHFTK